MDYVDWLRRAAIASEQAYKDTYECVLLNDLTARETFEYARNAARAHYRIAKNNCNGFGHINLVWGSQYRDIALYLLHHLRKAA